MNKSINIDFPFRDSEEGFFLKLNTEDTKAIKADLLHLILTNKGERLYLPEFGTNLRKHLFAPFDEITQEDIKSEMVEAIKKFIPNVRIDSIDIEESERNEYGVTVKLKYTITEDVFEFSDMVIIQL